MSGAPFAGRRLRSALVTRFLSIAGLVAWPLTALAQGAAEQRLDPIRTDAEAIAYKLTTALYHTTHQRDAFDVNIRGNLGPHAAWIGFYRRGDEFQQLRIGYSPTISVPFGNITASLEGASRGYLGGSVNAEIGDLYYGLLGLGRTNLKDYFNLTFDPNDSIVVGAGTRALPKTTLDVYQVRDNRLNTGQRVLHAVARVKPDERTRWTVDLFHRHGRPSAEDDVTFHGTGISMTYDFDRYFVRLAFDPHVNFTPDDMVRFAAGIRF